MVYVGKKILLFLIFSFLFTTLFGCATIFEGAKGIYGVSTKTLEDNRKSAITKTFNWDYFTCYAKTLDTLGRINTHIYAQDIKKHMIAIYISQEDTTPVGLFFKEIEAAKTQVEVSSPSTYAKESIAEKVFSAFDKKVTSKGQEVEPHAQKEMGDK